jgi:hypothetical protein
MAYLSSNPATIVAGVVCGLLALGLIIALLLHRRSNMRRAQHDGFVMEEITDHSSVRPASTAGSIYPFSVGMGATFSVPPREYAKSVTTPMMPSTPYSNARSPFPFLPPYTEQDPSETASQLAYTAFTDGDTLSTWAEQHRDVVTPELEDILRRAGYHPNLDPDRISSEEWMEMGVGAFGLALLRDLYYKAQLYVVPT